MVSASILYAASISVTVTKTEVSTSITTQTAISTTTVTATPTTSTSTNANNSIRATILAICSQDKSPGSGVWKLTAGTTQAAVICFQLYYYNSSEPLTLNTTQVLSIQALQYIANGSVNYPRSFSGAANFTVTPSQSELTIGGPSNENEGTVIGYAIIAKSGASGSYQLSFTPTASLTNWLLTSGEPLNCGYYGQLVAGTGQPNYVQPTGCVTYTTTGTATTSSTNSHSIPGITYQLLDGDIGFEITDVTNSTQIGGIG